MISNTSTDIAGQNTFTAVLQFRKSSVAFGFAVSGTWAGTLIVQCRQKTTGNTDTWRTVWSGTSNPSRMRRVEIIDENLEWRIGFADGGYTSGTATVVIVGNTTTGG